MSVFHLATTVGNLSEAVRFYGEVLGCEPGRSTDTWADFDFFGHQISLHVGEAVTDRDTESRVAGSAVPVPHFGAVLDWDAFDALLGRLEAHGVELLIPVKLRFPGEPGEQRSCFLRDPAGNALEFKSFRNPADVFAH
ncbi:MAG: VOC family protein [Planctomycetota bacterium]